jgi:acyl-CoA dehydrogenase
MDFDPPESVRPLLEKIEKFIEGVVMPVEHDVLERGFHAAAPVLAELRGKCKAAGMWAPQLPKDVGGLGLSLVEHGLVSERLGRSPLGHYVFGAQAPDAGNAEILHKFGTAEQKARWLEPLARGDIRSCFSMTEPENPGSNPTMLSTTARRDGDHYVIDGHKWFTSSADGAAFAIVMAVTNPEASQHARASMIIVPTDAPGFDRVRNIKIMGDAGEAWASHSEIWYRGVRVPVENRLGGEGAGFLIAQERLGPGRIHHCMRSIGAAELALELMIDRAQSRVAFGKPLNRHGTVGEWIARSRIEIDQARLLVLKAAWMIDKVGAKAARKEISMIKALVPTVYTDVCDRAMQVFGAAGLSPDTPLADLWTWGRALRFADGPDEVHLQAIARMEIKDGEPGSTAPYLTPPPRG